MFSTGTIIAFVSALVIGLQAIPPGTVIPIMLDTTLNSSKDAAGKKIGGKVMQEVPLPSGGSIKRLARVSGHIVSVSDTPGDAKITLKFDTVQDDGQAVPANLGQLAVASMAGVADAQSPISANSDRDPMSQWTTRQVGGDVVYRGRGKVSSVNGLWGRWIEGSSVLIKLTPSPSAGCEEGTGYDREQAVWIFSSTACGTFGLKDVKISNAGRSPATREITLASKKTITIRGGSGWMLIATGE